jgi:glycosyltransferase involved in cell wall biosynthesis
MSALNVCTIVSKNYIAYARVLADSFYKQQSEGQFFVLLVDRNDGHIDPEKERFTLIEAEELDNIPARESFLFKYTLLECNTAIKPYFLEHLFQRYDLENLVYFDPDILITHPLDELEKLVEKHSIVLTPHLTDPVNDRAHPGELTVLQVGAYNLGFVALRRSEVTERFLPWWQDRLYDRCLVALEEGLFVDQKWMDLTPGLFKDVHILTDPGYNVAYWNLHGRRVTVQGDDVRCNDRPLVFYHFSGIDPDNIQPVSKHQDRFTLADIGDAAQLFRRYRDLVLAAGYHEAKPWPYAFGVFDNGVPIPNAARTIYLRLGNKRKRFGDPFKVTGKQSFFQYLNEPRRPRKEECLTRLLGHLYELRPDLMQIFPDVDGRDYLDFCAWLLDFGRYELKLDEVFLGGLERDTRATLFTSAGMKRRVTNRMKRLYHSETGQKARQTSKRVLGRERYQDLRQKLRGPTGSGAAAAEPGGGAGGYVLPLPSSMENPGVNLVGYLQAETGMGEAARSLAKALEAAGIPMTLHSLDLNVLARNDDASFAVEESDFPYDLNLFVVNADQVLPVFEHLGAEVFAGRFNVGFWLWELEVFPEAWRAAFDLLHEVWTPSSFCVNAISSLSPIPVPRGPVPVVDEVSDAYDRSHFELEDDAFVFLFIFNFLSYFERKNPVALIRAFRSAFPDPAGGTQLLLKTSHSEFAPEALKRILEEIGPATHIRIVDGYLDRAEITALTALTDAYASLHRSEGYGLTLAEAMLLGKPVVATPYSGNADFFDLNNGFPVRYSLVELTENAGPYPAGARWAEPDVAHAAELLRRVREQRQEDRPRLERAHRDIAENLSFAAIGRQLAQRLREAVARVERGGRWLLR